MNIGGEELQLEHLGGWGVMPNRKKQLQHVLRLLKEGDPNDWNNLPSLLRGLHMMGKDPPPRVKARMVRLATERGRFGVILRCLNGANNTGLTLKDPEVLEQVIWSLRQIAQNGEWNEEATAKAIKDANEVASQLESDVHGTGRHLAQDDPRRSPYVLGIFLELASVYAWRFKGGEDDDGKVKAFADRLLSNIAEGVKVVRINVSALYSNAADDLVDPRTFARWWTNHANAPLCAHSTRLKACGADAGRIHAAENEGGRSYEELRAHPSSNGADAGREE